MAQTYKTGDILVVGMKYFPILHHLAIVFYKDGTGYVAHNTGYKKKIIATPLDEFTHANKIQRIISVPGLTDNGIYNKMEECNRLGKGYSLLGYNCESFIREICNCDFGLSQKKSIIILLFSIAIFSIILYIIIKKIL